MQRSNVDHVLLPTSFMSELLAQAVDWCSSACHAGWTLTLESPLLDVTRDQLVMTVEGEFLSDLALGMLSWMFCLACFFCQVPTSCPGFKLIESGCIWAKAGEGKREGKGWHLRHNSLEWSDWW